MVYWEKYQLNRKTQQNRKKKLDLGFIEIFDYIASWTQTTAPRSDAVSQIAISSKYFN